MNANPICPNCGRKMQVVFYNAYCMCEDKQTSNNNYKKDIEDHIIINDIIFSYGFCKSQEQDGLMIFPKGDKDPWFFNNDDMKNILYFTEFFTDKSRQINCTKFVWKDRNLFIQSHRRAIFEDYWSFSIQEVIEIRTFIRKMGFRK